jgi:AbrB family looped-hinge helix DNA binding protein
MSAEGQITLPNWVRDRLGLNGGESFLVEEDGKDILLRRLKKLRRFGGEENTLAGYLAADSPPAH